jgi:hypothetical protein
MYTKTKFLILILAICFSQITLAQKFASGFGVGALMTGGQYKDSFDVKKTTSMRPGFKVYWAGRVNIEGNVNFAPEVGYSMKGFRVKNPNPSIKDQELIIHYLEFKFIQEYTVKERFFVKIGPSISAAIAGRDKQLSATGLRSNDPIPFNFAAWGRFEGAVNLSVGTHFGSGWLAEIGTTKGISNIWDGDEGPNVKNVVFGISIAKYLR